MSNRLEIYKCASCGAMLEMLRGGEAPSCCGKTMTLLKENTTEAAVEKHVPVIEKTPTGYKVKVGGIPHPMTEEHLIEWIELLADGKSYRQFLNPGDAPEAVFELTAESVTAREHCNLHGLWKS